MNMQLINVLLIEDNPGDVRLIRELLVKTDQTSFHLECVTRLSEGLARLSRDGIDVVLLDLSLPDSRGFQTFATVQDQASRVPIIVLTALDDEALATRAMRDGAQDYLLKGHVDTNMLVRAIRYAIERKRVEEALRHSENQYRTTIDSMGDAIHVVDRDLRILLFNETFRRWNEKLGLESNVFGKALYEVFPFLPDTVRDEYHQVFKSGRVLVTEECTTIQDHEFMTETRKIPVFEDKAVARVVTVVRDISGRKRGEEALRESEGKYRNLIDNSRDAIYLLYDGKFEIINKRFEELFGYTQDDTNAPDFNFINLVAPQSRGLIKERVQKVEKGESVHPQYEFTAITRDGREVEVETSVSYIEYKGGIATQGILRDITERKRAEEVLRERAARLGVIASIGQKTTVIMELDELLHHAVNLIGETFNYYNVIILLVDESEIVLRATTLPFLKPLEGQVRLRIGSEGITGWVAEHGEPLVIPDVIQDARYVAALEEMDVQSEMAVPIVSKGTVIGVLDAQNSQRDAFTQDDVFTLQTLADQLAVAIENARLYEQASQEIGERKRIEESLRIERDKLRNILDNMNDQVVIENESFHIIYQNRKSIETVGDKSGSTCYETFRNRRQPCDQHFCSVKHVLKEKGNGPYCYTTEAKDGLNWEVVALPISDEKGQRVVLEIVRDITERKQLQEQLLQSEKMSAVGQLISGVAHELNNPLTGILGFSQLLLMSQDLQESARHSIETIHHEAERARKIVQNLLTFSRHRKATKKKVFINEIVGQTLDLRAYEMRVSNIEIIRTFDSKCPPIHGDDHQLQQVFMNLIINAEQAMLEAHGKGHLGTAH
jgi:PAS domain S-box-containing protein